MIFNGFEQILMAVIEQTTHSEDMDNKGKTRVSNEQRFDDAMLAIFGSQYECHFKKTADFSVHDLMKIKHLNTSGKSFRSSVREVVKENLPESKDGSKADKKIFDEALERYVSQAKKHFKRNNDHYKTFIPLQNNQDIKQSIYLNDEDQELYIEQRKNIFKALNAAGWHIL